MNGTLRSYLLACLALLATSFGAAPAVADTPANARATVQHLLRRFAFSASPEMVTAVQNQGIKAWVAQQLNPNAINDAAATAQLDPYTTVYGANYAIADTGAYERRLIQRDVWSQRQLLLKLEQHWLDHFSIGNAKVLDLSHMFRYETTLSQLALGNFSALVSAVAKQPAMLTWLDNLWNYGPAPNENFARELMQLFVFGEFKLNQDGSVVTDASGKPVPNYTQADIGQIARALTGYGINFNAADTNPLTAPQVVFNAGIHTTGPFTFLGASRAVPATALAADYVIGIMAHNPSTAPFQVKELLQRFVTETPSAKYISDIAKVWTAAVDAPDQIAQVIAAIIAHPEFNSGYHAMAKQPIELEIGLLRQLPGVLQASAGNHPGDDLIGSSGLLAQLSQDPFYAPSVFGFYQPGGLDALVNTNSLLVRARLMGNLLTAQPATNGVSTLINIATLRQRIGSSAPGPIATYLLDAMVDGGSTVLRQVVLAALGTAPTDTQIRGALWLIATSPDYQVN